MKRKTTCFGLMIALLLIGVTAGGCAAGVDTYTQNAEGTRTINSGFVPMAPGIYDSQDTAVVISRNIEKRTMTFQNLETGKQYTLYYDGTTTAKDKYENEIALSQIPDGAIVEDRFFKSKKALTYVRLSPDAFNFEELKNYTLLPENNQILIGTNPYALGGNLSILSDGKRIETMDINSSDVIRVSGVGSTVYSIVVEQGHGYLRLKNEDYFIDGWLEIGQTVIRDVQEDMLVTVPEGTYQVKISKDGNEANQTITFARDEEMVWDLGTVAIKEAQKGTLIFTLHPMDAQITIDGEAVDTSQPYETEYGVHQLIATAEGYDTITQYIKLNDEYANLDITMVETDGEEDETKNDSEGITQESATSTATDMAATNTADSTNSSGSTTAKAVDNTSSSGSTTTKATDSTNTSGSTATNTTTGSASARVYIDSPKNVEVYLDGNYVGVAPVDFKKEVGSYVITLRKNGYQTRSYSISFEDDNQDVNFSFSDLLELEE